MRYLEVKHKLENKDIFREIKGRGDIKFDRKKQNYRLLAVANPCSDFFFPPAVLLDTNEESLL